MEREVNSWQTRIHPSASQHTDWETGFSGKERLTKLRFNHAGFDNSHGFIIVSRYSVCYNLLKAKTILMLNDHCVGYTTTG